MRIPFTSDGTQFKRGLDNMRKDTKSFSDDVKGYLIGAFGGLAVLTGIKKLIDAASDLRESVSKSGEIFGRNSRVVEDWAASLEKSFGQSKAKALEAVTGFGSMFNVLGVGREESSKMSQKLVELASDLASFNNTSVDDALQALGAGLRGESEPLRRFAVFLDDATLRQKALAMGIYDGTGTLTNSQKVMAAYNVILQQTASAQGDFARTSDGAANSQRIVQAQMENSAATIGGALLPAYEKLLGVIKSQDTVEAAKLIGYGIEAIIEGWQVLFKSLGAIIGGIYGIVSFQLSQMIGGIGDVASALSGLASGDFGKVSAAAQNFASRFGDSIKNVGEEVEATKKAISEMMKELVAEPESQTSSKDSEDKAKRELETTIERKKLEDEIAKMEEDAKQRQMTVAEKLLDLERKRAEAVASMYSADEGSDEVLKAKKDILAMDKEIGALREQQAKDDDARAKKLDDLNQKMQDLNEAEKFESMTDDEKIASLTTKKEAFEKESLDQFAKGDFAGSVESSIKAKEIEVQIKELVNDRSQRERDLADELQASKESNMFDSLTDKEKKSYLEGKREGFNREADKASRAGNVEDALKFRIKSEDITSQLKSLTSERSEPSIIVSSLAEVGGGGGVALSSVDPMLRAAQDQAGLQREANDLLRSLIGVISQRNNNNSQPVA